jgi:hypothetical protein
MNEETTATIHIPGELIARYRDGRITALQWWPSASNAGYFGPSATVLSGDIALDIESETGPFWSAVQTALADGMTIEWSE